MSRIKLKHTDREDLFLYTTDVENLFINEFLPGAPGDYVKVYLFGLMYAQFEQEIDSKLMSVALGINESEIIKAWEYWSDKGVVRIFPIDEGKAHGVEYIRQIDKLYGRCTTEIIKDNSDEISVHKYEKENSDDVIRKLVDRQIREIFAIYERETGRTVSRRETEKLSDAVNLYGVEPDVLSYAITYCNDIDKSSVEYIVKVALRWTEEGLKNVKQVKEYLDKYSCRNSYYGLIFKELSFVRLPTPMDREMMDRWFDEMGFTLKDVLEACRATVGLREPNLRYVNKVLENKMLEKGGIDTKKISTSTGDIKDKSKIAIVSRKVLSDYYQHIRDESLSAQKTRIKNICDKIPEMRLLYSKENEINAAMMNIKIGSSEGRKKRQAIKEKRNIIAAKKRQILIDNGYDEDYIDLHYRCNICKDTGITDDGRFCECSAKRAEEAYEWINNNK